MVGGHRRRRVLAQPWSELIARQPLERTREEQNDDVHLVTLRCGSLSRSMGYLSPCWSPLDHSSRGGHWLRLAFKLRAPSTRPSGELYCAVAGFLGLSPRFAVATG